METWRAALHYCKSNVCLWSILFNFYGYKIQYHVILIHQSNVDLNMYSLSLKFWEIAYSYAILSLTILIENDNWSSLFALQGCHLE